MTTLTEQFKQALNGLAFADIGERVGYRDKYAALYPDSTSAAPARTPAAARKWIALGVGASLPWYVMSYVIGACRRMQADLLLISDDAMRVRVLLAEYLPELEGITCQTEEVANSAAVSVVQALDLHRGVLFAVSGTDDDPLHPLLRARRGVRSPVPVVLVSPKAACPPASCRASGSTCFASPCSE
jgi:hypothetical protein